MLWKESEDGAHWRAGDVEEEGEMKTRTLMMNDNDNDNALLVIKDGVEVATIAPRIMAVRCLACSLPPTLPKSNIGLPRTLQLLQSPEICVSPILWSSCGGTQSQSPPLQPYSHPYNLSTTAGTSPPLFLTSGNPVVRSVFPFTLSITVKMAPTPPHPYSPCHQHPDDYNDPAIICLDAQGAHPVHEHSLHAHSSRI
ncbi:hypothetical protein ARMSODRAFT_1027867 [Armillaria solidipes]|uniref:Uncharacterized protein n=1 Tax=Armillaria solidipes TaxID=1076256 RepID=A0A2H3AQ72_9AGAR|nr:hypothetical protein ARMSODRAFT_1027867 [Armillaria solidipes]